MTISQKKKKVKKKGKRGAQRRKKKKVERASPRTKVRKVKKRPKPKPKPPKKKRRLLQTKAAKKRREQYKKRQLRKAEATPEEVLDYFRRPEIERRVVDQLGRTGLLRPGMVRTVESVMLSTLIVAEQLGNFEERAKELAVEYGWDLREVYTLWYSP